jgi:hypothetical protein
MTAHVHRLNREKFIAEMAKRGWQLDTAGWIIPEGRRIHQRESDWLASILLAIECECPLGNQQEGTVEVVRAWANDKLPREFDPLGLALANLCERLERARVAKPNES